MCRHCGAPLEPQALACAACGRSQEMLEHPKPQPEQPVAHADPCPKHPALPIAGSCPRCGALVCIRCAPGAASAMLSCTDCLAREQQRYALRPSPFGGPLVFPLLGLILRVLMAATTVTVALDDVDALTLTEKLALPLIALTAVATLPGFAGFLMRRRWAPPLLATLYVLDVIGALAGWRPLSPLIVGWSAAWGLYFLTSPRVKATFTE